MQVLEVAGGDHPDVELSFAGPVVVRDAARPTAPVLVAAATPVPSPSRTPFWFSLGVTGAVGVATLTTGLMALSAKRGLDGELDRFPIDETRVRSARSELATTALLTDVLGAVTLVGIGVTTYFALSTRRSSNSAPVQVGIGPGSFAAQGHFQ